MVLQGPELAPAPRDGFARPQHHVHRGFRLAAALSVDLRLGEVQRRHSLAVPLRVEHEDPAGVGALDEVMVPGELHVAGRGLVVSQKIHAVQVTVEEMPRAVAEGLADAVSEGAGRRRLETRLLEKGPETNRIVAAGVVAVNVEHLDRVAQLAVVAGRVVPMLDLLEPDGKRLLQVGHAGSDRRLDDLGYVSEVVPAVGQPGVDHVGIAHVLHPHRAIRLPGLEERTLRVHADSHRRAATASVHRPALHHFVALRALGDLLDVGLRRVGRVRFHLPRADELRRPPLRRRSFRAGPLDLRTRRALFLLRARQRLVLANDRRDADLVQQPVEVRGR